MNHGGDFVEVTCAHLLLMRHKCVTVLARLELRLLHHLGVVLHTLAARVGLGELEAVVPVDVDTRQRDELILVTEGGQVFLERRNLRVV